MRIILVKFLKRNTMFLFFRWIFVTNEFLTTTSDKHFNSALWHEYGHKKFFPIMASSLGFIFCGMILLFLYFPFVIFFSPLIYLLLCFLARQGEYYADRYSLTYTDMESMMELLQGEGERLDTKLSNLFYLFRWHPSKCRRIKKLGGK